MSDRKFEYTIDADEMEASGVRTVDLVEADNVRVVEVAPSGEAAEEELPPEIIGGKDKLQNKEYRDAYVSANIRIGFRFQMRAMRNSRAWTQTALGEKAGMPRNAVSRLESREYGDPSISTLLRLARAFDVGLMVRFVPFSRLLEEYGNLSPERLNAVSFEDDSFGEAAPVKEEAGLDANGTSTRERGSYHSRIASMSVAESDSRPDSEPTDWLKWGHGVCDARHAAAEIAAEADKRIAELETELKIARETIAELRDANERAFKIQAEEANKKLAEVEARLKEAEGDIEELTFCEDCGEDDTKLKENNCWPPRYCHSCRHKLVTEICEIRKRAEKAEADAGRLRGALKEYADTANWYEDRGDGGTPQWGWLGGDPTLTAQLALSPADDEKGGEGVSELDYLIFANDAKYPIAGFAFKDDAVAWVMAKRWARKWKVEIRKSDKVLVAFRADARGNIGEAELDDTAA